MKQMCLVGAALALGAAACSKPDAPKVTFWQDVAPIYFTNCVTCHQSDGIAPFNLDNYEDAKQWAEPARRAMEDRIMPPWLLTGDGTCGEFRHSLWLDDADIQTVAAWIDEGIAEGEPRSDLTLPPSETLAEAVDFVTPDFVPEIQEDGYAAFDEYRCFLIDTEIAADQFITGYEVIPGNPALVHHALAFVVNPDQEVSDDGKTNRDVMRELDEASPDRKGWPCYGLAGSGVDVESIPVTWAPGMGVVPFPGQSGVQVRQGDQVVVQVHYNLADEAVRGQSDSTVVRLNLQDSVEREGLFALPDPFLDSADNGDPDTLAPGQESIEYTWELPLGLLLAEAGIPELHLYGIFPHMHELGRTFRFEVTDSSGLTDSTEQCGAEVKRWDFDWQLFYFYQQPIRIGHGTSIKTTCSYDTRGRTEPALPGWGTQDEMCLAGLYLIFP